MSHDKFYTDLMQIWKNGGKDGTEGGWAGIYYGVFNKVVKENHAKKKDYSVFRLLKTLKPDVYELYQQDDDSLQKKGIALVQTIELSHKLADYCRSSGEIYVKCRFDRDFKKWEPFERTTESPSTVQDL